MKHYVTVLDKQKNIKEEQDTRSMYASTLVSMCVIHYTVLGIRYLDIT